MQNSAELTILIPTLYSYIICKSMFHIKNLQIQTPRIYFLHIFFKLF